MNINSERKEITKNIGSKYITDLDSNRINNSNANKNIYVSRVKQTNQAVSSLVTDNHNSNHNNNHLNSNITSLNSINKSKEVNNSNYYVKKVEKMKLNNNSIESTSTEINILDNNTNLKTDLKDYKSNYSGTKIQKNTTNTANVVLSNSNSQQNKINNSNIRASSSHINKLKIDSSSNSTHQSHVNINNPVRLNSQVKPKTAISRQISNPIVKINNYNYNSQLKTNITSTLDSLSTHLITNEQPIHSVDRFSSNIPLNQYQYNSNPYKYNLNHNENKNSHVSHTSQSHISSNNLNTKNKNLNQVVKNNVLSYGSNYQNYKGKVLTLNTNTNINNKSNNVMGNKNLISPSSKVEKEKPVIVKIKSTLIDSKSNASKVLGQVTENRYDIYSRPVTCKQPVQARIKQNNLHENKIIVPVNISNVYRSNSSAKPRIVKKLL